MNRKKFITDLTFGGIGLTAFGLSSNYNNQINEIKKTFFINNNIKI